MPWWFSALNGLWKGSYPIGTRVVLDKDSLIKTARNQTGLSDLGADFWDEPLDRLLTSINQEARLHPIGRFITKQRLVNLLSVRLRAEAYFKKYPEILDQDLYPISVILGLQRTGTTKLQRLMAVDPNCRALMSWEALNPAPLKGDDHTGLERIKQARLSEKALKKMSPGFFAIHPVEHLAPEEDVLLLDVSFMSTTAEATMNVPSYAAWLEKTDQSQAYQYTAKLLKFLQWQRPAKRWVLKTPHHLEFPHLISDNWGQVEFIWTHRDVQQAIPSFLSMLAYSRVLFSKEVSAEEVAHQWVRKISHMLKKAVEFRTDPVNNDKFLDVTYTDLISDSQGVLSRIYSKNGEKLTPDLEHLFRLEEKKSPKGKYGVHRYDLSDFNINAPYIQNHTESYNQFLERLNINLSGKQ